MTLTSMRVGGSRAEGGEKQEGGRGEAGGREGGSREEGGGKLGGGRGEAGEANHNRLGGKPALTSGSHPLPFPLPPPPSFPFCLSLSSLCPLYIHLCPSPSVSPPLPSPLFLPPLSLPLCPSTSPPCPYPSDLPISPALGTHCGWTEQGRMREMLHTMVPMATWVGVGDKDKRHPIGVAEATTRGEGQAAATGATAYARDVGFSY
ncbi:unnamed protein product [Closterium sp. NIES-64]|nr:unnamed protein product [Closterium sp. NIES-64]